MDYTREIVLSLIIVAVAVLLRLLLERGVIKRVLKKQFDRNRRKMVSKVFNMALVVVVAIGLTSVWGLDQSEIILFVTSALTILGVAFFAQWSHLSNITAGIILFFDSSIKIGDTISILEKDFNITGVIDDIDTLSVKLSTKDGIVLIPNNILLQKPIRIEKREHIV